MSQELANRIEKAARRDILVYGISYIDLLEANVWEVDSRKWMSEIYSVVNPYQIEKNPLGLARTLVIQKSTQCGMSTMAAVRLFHFADFWATRSIYMLPRQQDYLDFTTTRIDPMIRRSDRLANILGTPDSTRAKQLGSSYMFFMESTVEPRMMPADAVFIDELDLSDMTNVATAGNRMDNSRWRLFYYFSTPTLPYYGINGLYANSDKRSWLVKCPSCGHWQKLDWNEHLRVIGAPQNPKKVYFGCLNCDHALTLQEIQDFGMWVPEYPEKEKDVVGFHISQMYTHTAEHLYGVFRNPLTKLVEFYRKNLGMPYEIGGGSLAIEDVYANCFDLNTEVELIPDGISSYYIGVDQGNELQAVVGKVKPDTNKIQVVNVLSIPFEEGFDELGRLIRIYKPKRVVLDGDPNRHSARKLQLDFLGKLLIADYSVSTVEWVTKKDADKPVITNVVIGRSAGFDRLTDSIKDNEWDFPGTLPILPTETDKLIDHLLAIKRDIETQRTGSGEKEVVVWRELRPAHFAHAMLYLKTAVEIAKGKKFRTAMIGKHQEEGVDSDDEIDYTVKNNIVNIIAALAEAPTEQLKLYSPGIPEYNLNFPLSHKLKKVREIYNEEDISRAVEALLQDRLLYIP